MATRRGIEIDGAVLKFDFAGELMSQRMPIDSLWGGGDEECFYEDGEVDDRAEKK